MNLIPPTLGPGAAALVATVDRIVTDKRLPTCAVGADKAGAITLLLGAMWEGWDDDARSWALEHEACHIALQHPRRAVIVRDAEVAAGREWLGAAWNLASDAAIHHRCMDPLKLAGTGVDPVTFSHIELEPCSPEVAYAQLRQRAEQSGGGCGRDGAVDLDELPEWAQAEIAEAVDRATRHLSAPGTLALPRPPLADTARPPAWARELVAHLQRTAGREIRGRSWRRANRAAPWLPGMSRTEDLSGVVFVDCSGSMPDALLASVAALLASIHYRVEVVLWAIEHTARLSPRAALTLLRDGVGPGGGTDPIPASALRRHGERAIWITDSEVGAWPTLSQNDVVLTIGEDAPLPSKTIKIEEK